MKEILINNINDFEINNNFLKIKKGNIEINLLKCKTEKRNDHLKSVGERDICNNPPFFNIFSENGNIKIYFKTNKIFFKKRNNERLFHQFYLKLKENNFTSLDLS